jgi:hypothetical protein
MSIKTVTANGAATFKSTGDALVNLFFQIGASRNNPDAAKRLFDAAMADDLLKATAILCWARDARGGAGERNIFRVLVKELVDSDESLARKVVNLVPRIGRFDDLTVFYGTKVEADAINVWVGALRSDNALAAKWADRKDKKLQRALRMNEAALRKFLSNMRKHTIVENAMCQNEWSNIEYGKLPSVAGMRYSKAFKKHDETRYAEFMGNKNTKVNAGVAYPYDVYRLLMAGQSDATVVAAATKYWENLNKLSVAGNILCMADVSGSMAGAIASGSVTCMDVSISLSVFLSQQIKGAFNGKLMTFSESPTLVNLPSKGNLLDLFQFTSRMNWGMNTNLEAAFAAILKEAVRFKVKPADMPTMLLVLSDMEFDRAAGGATLSDSMKAQYKAAGYEPPKMCWWNLNGSGKNFPVMKNEKGSCLVSGFSPKVLEAVIAAKEFTPISVVEEAIKPYLDLLK